MKNIVTNEESLAQKQAIGISNVHGDLIVFLEDDDLFTKDKIKETTYKFSKYDIGFYHNAQEVFYDEITGSYSPPNNQRLLYYDKINKRKLKDLLFKFKAGFNVSSIVINRDLAVRCVNLLKNVKITVDTFLLFCAVENNVSIMIDFRKLTYRVLLSKGLNTDVNVSLFKMQYDDALYFKQIFTNKVLKDFIEMSIIQRGLLYKILSKEISKKEALTSTIESLKYSLKYPNKWNFFL